MKFLFVHSKGTRLVEVIYWVFLLGREFAAEALVVAGRDPIDHSVGALLPLHHRGVWMRSE